jgi:general secretion pathway protein G
VKQLSTSRERPPVRRQARGFTLLELIITLGVLSIIAVAAIPYMKNSIKRDREYVLRSNLRTMRKAIDLYFVNCEYLKLVSALDQQEGGMCYPPDLQTLVEGIRPPNKDVKIRFLRRIPVDPMTGKADWGKKAVQDDADTQGWNGKNVFDVYSLSTGVALNGTKYRDW